MIKTKSILKLPTCYPKILYATSLQRDKYIIAAIKSPGIEMIVYLDGNGNVLNQI